MTVIEQKVARTAHTSDADTAAPAPVAEKASNTRPTTPPTSDDEDEPPLLVSSPQHYSCPNALPAGSNPDTHAKTTDPAREPILAGQPIGSTDESVGSASFVLSGRLKQKPFCGGRLVTDVASVYNVDMSAVDLCDLPALQRIEQYNA